MIAFTRTSLRQNNRMNQNRNNIARSLRSVTFLPGLVILDVIRHTQMQLRFDTCNIETLSASYVSGLNPRDRLLTERMVGDVFPRYSANGYLSKPDFLTVCAWKTPRTKSRCEANDESFIREISAIALTTESEQLRIEIWTLLRGVQWPTASVFLHFALPDRYPILDFRATWSLGADKPKQYTCDFWHPYSTCCREIADTNNVSMRTLDQSLWQYSKLYQPKSG